MIKNKYVAFGLFVVFTLIIWNVLGYFYTTVITRASYRFSASTDIAMPLVMACITGYFFFLREDTNSNNRKNGKNR